MPRAKKQNTLYVLHAWLSRNDVNVADLIASKLWDKRLCDLSQNNIKMLAGDRKHASRQMC